MKKIIIMVAGALLLIGASVGGTLFLTGGFDKKEPAIGEDGEVIDAEEEKAPPETFYYQFKPEFIVNFSGKTRGRYFMIEVSASTEDEEVLATLEKHNPEIRNDLLVLFSDQDAALVNTASGKVKLRADALSTLQKVVEKHMGVVGVKDIFFTRFVVQ
jgi:flagellar FliL protein